MKNIKNNLTRLFVYSKIKLMTLLFTFTIISFNGCDGFVDVDLPKSQLTADDVFLDKATANAAMTNIYAKIRDKGILAGTTEGMSHQLGNYTDELAFYGNAAGTSMQFNTNTVLSTNRNIADWWNFTYNQIYDANALYKGIDGSTALTTEDKNQLKGEALFIRALLHFYLVNLYGNIPYITSTDYTQNTNVKRMPENEVYPKIKADLISAIELLPVKYTSTERVRPNRFVARALLSRVNLYMKIWDEAANDASALINNQDYAIVTLSTSFLKSSPETIWRFSPSANGGNSQEAVTFIFTSGPPPQSALSQSMLSAFETNDQRKIQWVKSLTKGSQTWSYPFKYKQKENTGSSVEFSVVLRLAEQYLIRAEARAQQEDLIGAKEDLNKIRNRAGLNETTAIGKEQIIDAIRHERRVELFTEYGHRFFDLKRTETLDKELAPVKQGWQHHKRLFPVPQAELLLNPNLLPQNPEY